jgi:mannitol-specific phosphotransferase system IIBC component
MEQQSQGVLGGAPAAPAAAPAPKKSSAGIIVAIIAAALLIAGGVVAAILIVNNNGDKKDDETSKQESKKDDDKKLDKDEDEEEDDEDNEDNEEDKDDEDEDDSLSETAYSYTSNDAYFVKINGKKYNFNSTMSDVEKSGFKMSSQAKEKTVKSGQYLILMGGGTRLTKGDAGLGYTPYNDGSSTVSISDAKLGSISVNSTSLESAQSVLKKITFNGGIHLGSTVAQLKKAFGEPTKLDQASYGDTYEYKASTYKKFTIKVKDGVVTEISWTNYGKFAN